eukprot:12308907-Prorocentrum_lima.AAC.1
MTSSLVGSEMCIRDRLNPIVDTHPVLDLTPTCRPRVAGPSVTILPLKSCLLYTSDAADDM